MQIEVVTNIALVAARVRELGNDRTIVNNMAKEIRSAVPPIRKAVKANAISYLPHRGGLGRWVARTSVTGQVKRSARSAGVWIKGGRNSTRGRSDISAINRGRVRHPLPNSRRVWSNQTVPAGFFTDAVDAGADAFREAIVVAVDKAVKEVGL